MSQGSADFAAAGDEDAADAVAASFGTVIAVVERYTVPALDPVPVLVFAAAAPADLGPAPFLSNSTPVPVPVLAPGP